MTSRTSVCRHGRSEYANSQVGTSRRKTRAGAGLDAFVAVPSLRQTRFESIAVGGSGAGGALDSHHFLIADAHEPSGSEGRRNLG